VSLPDVSKTVRIHAVRMVSGDSNYNRLVICISIRTKRTYWKRFWLQCTNGSSVVHCLKYKHIFRDWKNKTVISPSGTPTE